MKCPNCNRDIPDDSIYCLRCRYRIKPIMSSIIDKEEMINLDDIHIESSELKDFRIDKLKELEALLFNDEEEDD